MIPKGGRYVISDNINKVTVKSVNYDNNEIIFSNFATPYYYPVH